MPQKKYTLPEIYPPIIVQCACIQTGLFQGVMGGGVKNSPKIPFFKQNSYKSIGYQSNEVPCEISCNLALKL